MCNNCNKETPYYKAVVDDGCFQVEETKCDEGCEQTIPTDCVFHNINNDDDSAKLPNINVLAGASLTYILKQINKKFGEYLTADFSSFNMNGLDAGLTIENLKGFVEATTAAIKVLKANDTTVSGKITQLEEDLAALQQLVASNNKPAVSSSPLNINSTDTVKAVLAKIITYVESINTSTQAAEYTFQDSESVEFSTTSSNSVISTLKVSAKSGNRAFVEEDGLYVTDSSVSSFLGAILNDVTLKTLFTNLVKSTFPCFYFDILSSKNQVISYINCVGEQVSITAKANQVLPLKDVRRIITVPGAELTITFKGI